MKTAKPAAVGARHGNWLVVGGTVSRPIGKCGCGTERRLYGHDLRSGRSKSCGCVISEATLAANARKRRHGLSDSATMSSWTEMKRRCYAEHRKEYANYGGRGIYVCDRWLASFENFLSDMGIRPDGLTLERINNDGPYSPDNCRWESRKVQERNKRSSARYSFLGTEMTVAEAAERFGFKPMTLYNRINTLGWSPDKAVSQPVRGAH